MSEFEKINIYVPNHIGDLLDKDASMFEIYKKDGRTINRNRFLSMLLIGYYGTYVDDCNQSYKTILEMLKMEGIDPVKSHELAKRILKKVVLPNIPLRKGKNPTRLSLKSTKDTEGLINSILDDLGENEYFSQYFCQMLMSYCKKPFSEREQIIFRDNHEKLLFACKEMRPITFSTIWNPKKIHTVIPYQLAVGREEMFNYLLCAERNSYSGKQEAIAYRLNRITKINFSNKSDIISEKVLDYLNKMLHYGPQYPINDDEESCVRLTEAGRKSYSRIYYGRPQVDRIEEHTNGYYYYFKGSKYQVFIYFRRFGYNEAEIIYPESLRQKMSEFHLKAYENYK